MTANLKEVIELIKVKALEDSSKIEEIVEKMDTLIAVYKDLGLKQVNQRLAKGVNPGIDKELHQRQALIESTILEIMELVDRMPEYIGAGETIPDETYTHSGRVLIFGGRVIEPKLATLRKLFPNVVFTWISNYGKGNTHSDSVKAAKAILSGSYDVVIPLNELMSHNEFNRITEACESASIPWAVGKKASIRSVMEILLTTLTPSTEPTTT